MKNVGWLQWKKGNRVQHDVKSTEEAEYQKLSFLPTLNYVTSLNNTNKK